MYCYIILCSITESIMGKFLKLYFHTSRELAGFRLYVYNFGLSLYGVRGRAIKQTENGIIWKIYCLFSSLFCRQNILSIVCFVTKLCYVCPAIVTLQYESESSDKILSVAVAKTKDSFVNWTLIIEN